MDYIEDIRQEKKVGHKLKYSIVIVLFATLANVDDWAEMEFFAHYHQKYLKKNIELKNGIPSHDPFCCVFSMISPDVLQQLYQKWQELPNRNEGEAIKKIICIDGKTMCSNNGRNILTKNINEEETICNQYESGGIFGSGIGFLKQRIYGIKERELFICMSCKESEFARHQLTAFFQKQQFCKAGNMKRGCKRKNGLNLIK